MNVRKILLAPGAAKYLGWAENKLAALETLRASSNLPSLSKALVIGGFTVLIKTDGAEGKIILSGGDLTHLLFNSAPQTTAYNYFKDIFSTAAPVYPGKLSPAFHSWCQFDSGYNQWAGRWKHGDIDEVVGGYFGGVALYELACYIKNNAVYGLTRGQFFQIVGPETTLQDALCFTDTYSANLALMPEADIDWCQLENTVLYKTYFHSSAIHEGFIWYPSFFYAEEENGMRMVGWFYGSADFAWAEGDGYTNLKVKNGICGRAELLGFIEARSPNLMKYGFGYCEMVTELNLQELVGGSEWVDVETELPILSFFISGIETGATVTTTRFVDSTESTPGSVVRVEVATPYSTLVTAPIETGIMEYFSWKSFGLESRAQMRGGTVPQGNPSRLFALYDPFENGLGPTALQMWAFDAWYQSDEDSLSLEIKTSDCLGIALVQGTTAIFYRYKGTLTEFYRTSSYHSHSISPGGQILAVFEGGDIIASVSVFDLFGEKIAPYVDNGSMAPSNGDYARGGYTVLRSGEDVSSYAATSAVIIPRRFDGFSPHIPLGWPPRSITPKTGAYYPAMGALRWQRDGNSGLLINKMVIADGTKGHVGQSIAECFDWEIVIDDPRTPPESDHEIIRWLETPEEWPPSVKGLDLLLGYVRGYFEGDHPNMRFMGEGNGDIKRVKMPEHFLFTSALGEPFWYADGAIGPLEVETLDYPPCSPGVYPRFRATDACGRVEQIDIEILEPDPMEAFQVDEITVFAVDLVISVSGGTAPYTSVFSGGEIDSGTITAIDPCSRGEAATVTFTDACGNTATYNGTMPDVGPVSVSVGGYNSSDSTKPPLIQVGTTASGSGGPAGTYSLSGGGTIDSATGEVTDLGAGCGTGTITYTNECGSASIQVAYPSGKWYLTTTTNYNLPVQRIAGSCSSACCWPSGCGATPTNYAITTIGTITKTVNTYNCCAPQDAYDAGCTTGTTYGAGDANCDSFSSGSYPNSFLRKREIYDWICP